jgi:hypothetical protein
MRQSKYWIGMGLVLSTLAFAGCKQESNSSISPKVAGGKGSPTGTLSKKDALKAQATAAVVDPSVDRCYQDLCTAESQEYTYESIFGQAARSTDDQHAYFQKNMAAVVRQYVDLSLANNSQLLTSVEAMESKLAGIKLSETEMRSVKAMIIFKKPDSLSEDLRNDFFKRGSEKPYTLAQLQNLSNLPAEALKIMYPKASTAEALKQESQAILSLRDSLKKALKMDIVTLDDSLFQQALKGESLSINEMKYILTRGYNLKVFNELAFGDMQDITNKFEMTERELILLYQDSKLKETLKPAHTAVQEYGYCEGRFYQSINLYPRQEQIDTFKALVPEVLQTVSSILPANDKAQEKLKTLIIGYPKMAGDIVLDWQNELRSATAEAQSTANVTKGLSPAGLKTLILLKSAMNNKNKQSVCDSIISLEVSDMSIPGSTQLNVSWFSVRYPMFGVGILAHEIGHIVQANSDAFETQKSCIVDRQDDDLKSKKSMSAFNMNEEFADMISAKVVKQLEPKLQFKAQNFGCYFASMDKSQMELVNVSPAGHSSGLFRALTIANLDGKKIPASCADLAAAKSSKVLNRCE